jgi:beta-glucosidase
MQPHFASPFLWGAVSGSHQTEGNNLASDWWFRENAKGSTVAERSGDATDAYHRWAEDMDLLAAAGLTDFRFGIEWSRIEPADGHISLAEVDHYRRMVEGAVARGIRPLLTLHHFTLPLWFAATGGWLRTDAAERFLSFIDAIALVIDAGVERVQTINEPNLVATFPVLGAGGMEQLNNGVPVPDSAVTAALIAVHHAARDRLHLRHPGVLVGWGVSVQNYQPATDAEDVFKQYVHPRDEVFVEAAEDDDWIGVQTYTGASIGKKDGLPYPMVEHDVERTLSGWEYTPAAIGGAVKRVASLLPSVPIIVTENGIATADDDRRIDYLRGALTSLEVAMSDGARVLGYFVWSLTDNWEWGSFTPTFGLVAVDRSNFQRSPKPSLAWFGARRTTAN